MYGRHLKLSHHMHTGHYRPHEYTSYLPLMILLVVVGCLLTVCSVYAAHPDPQSGSIGLTGIMPGQPPTTAAVITVPTDGQHFTTSPITVKGTCPASTLVEIYKSDIFAGSTMCSDTGTFELSIDLLIGKNILIARVYNELNQPGPDSNVVTVFYDALPPQASPITSLNFDTNQLILTTDAVFRGAFPEHSLSIPIGIVGGTAPYAVEVQWGDSNTNIIPRSDNVTFQASHIYHKPGTYQITLKGSDSKARTAFLTVAAIVNGQPVAATTTSTPQATVNKFLVLWPLYTSAVAVAISFWLGERREKHILTTRAVVVRPQA